MSKALKIASHLLEADPDELDPKGEMLRVDPSADIRRIIGRFKRQDLDVHSWSRLGDILKIKALPVDTGMHEEEVEMGVYAELQRLGIPVDPLSVVVSKRDGWFIIMFPLPGMPARSHKRRLPEAGPDEVDPKDYVRELPAREPRMAYALLPSVMLDPTETIVSPIIVKEGEPGYHQTDWRWNKAHAEAALDAMNAKLGLTPADAEYVLMSSMFPKDKKKRRLGETGPDDIDPKDEFMALDPLKAMYSQIAPAETGWARLQVVLKPSHREGEWVTRIRNADNGGESWGHYFMDYAEAVKDFRARCEKYGLPPEPMEITAVFEEGPDEVPNPKAALLGTQPSMDHWLRSHGFTPVHSGRPWFNKKFPKGNAAVEPGAGGLCSLNIKFDGGWHREYSNLDLNNLIHKLKLHEILTESGPDDVDPREYLRSLPARDPRIKTSFAKTTPESSADGDVSESGWYDEEGVSMLPDLIDHDDGLGIVEKAVAFLIDNDGVHASASHFHPGVWYSTDYYTTDYRTGEQEEKAYHLHGFLPEEEQEIWTRLRAVRNM